MTFLPRALDRRVKASRSGSEVSSWSSIRGGGAEGLAPGVEVFCLLSWPARLSISSWDIAIRLSVKRNRVG